METQACPLNAGGVGGGGVATGYVHVRRCIPPLNYDFHESRGGD